MRITIFLCLFLMCLHWASADTLYFKNGRKINGTIVEETEDSITVDIGGGTVTHQKDEIKSFEKDDIITSSIKMLKKPQETKKQLLKYYKKWNSAKIFVYIFIGLWFFAFLVFIIIKFINDKRQIEEYKKKQIINKDFWRVFYKK